MRFFRDEKGRDWGLHIDVGTIARIRNEFAIDLSKVLASREAIDELAGDVVKLVDVLWGLVKPQAEAKQVTPACFAEGLLGDAIENAGDALIEAIIDFFPSRRRELLRQMWTKGKELSETQLKAIETKLISGELLHDTQQSLESIQVISASEK
jgi:hypothetical protein